MKIHRLRYSRSKLTIIAVAAVEALEDIARLRMASAIQRIAAISTARCDLLEAELRAPGRQLALLPTIENAFARTA